MRLLRLGLLATLCAGALRGCGGVEPRIEGTTRLSATSDAVGPYEIHTVVRDAAGFTVELRYASPEVPSFVPRLMQADDSEETFVATIPGSPGGSEIAYYIAVLDGDEVIVTDPRAGEDAPYTFSILMP
ncbi:hypothetical protein [Haliangium ochraceum]|nr:hypothetical protein [Haliangium ochraceum]